MRRLAHVLGSIVVGSLGALGCGDAPMPAGGGDMGTPSTSMPLEPPPAGQGLQLKMAISIDAGQEFERCQFFTLPSGSFNVRKSQPWFTPGSHHVLLYGTDYPAVPTVDRDGKPLGFDASQPFDCSDGATARFDVASIVAASQNARGPAVVDLPPGVAVKMGSGSVVLLNAHYINATSQRIDGDVRVNLYTIADAEVKQEAGILFFYNPFIRVDPMSSSSARMVCPVTKDITLLNAQSHMHKRGVGYLANLVDGTSGARMEELYAGKAWSDVAVDVYAAGKSIKAGTSIDFHCDYTNTESRQIVQGPTTKDEMCMFIGTYYPRDRDMEYCSTASHTQDSAATWIGSGKASCQDALTCAGKAKGAGDFFGCVVDSCPSQGKQLSAVLHCTTAAQAAGGACKTPCSAGGDCQGCLINTCGSEIGACYGAGACQ